MEVPKGPRGSFKAQPAKGCQRYMSKVLDSHHEFSRSILSPMNFKSSNSRNNFTRKHIKSLNNPTVYQFYTLKAKQSTNFFYTNQIEVASDRTCQPWIAEVQSMQCFSTLWFQHVLIFQKHQGKYAYNLWWLQHVTTHWSPTFSGYGVSQCISVPVLSGLFTTKPET